VRIREVRARCGAAREIIRQVNDDLGQSEDLEQVILRELTGHIGHRRIAADLLIGEGLDWDEGELLDKHSAICAVVLNPDLVDQPQGG
jgi:hypothetical protein